MGSSGGQFSSMVWSGEGKDSQEYLRMSHTPIEGGCGVSASALSPACLLFLHQCHIHSNNRTGWSSRQNRESEESENTAAWERVELLSEEGGQEG
uniref:Uncharacterized protein n=1 Tax=Mustela putorius furo TaxID=9669 RepID=M3YM20_MUSPF